MHIVHVTASLSRLGAGVSNVVWSLAATQQSLGEDVLVAGLRDAYTQQDCRRHSRIPFCAAAVTGPARLGYSRSLWTNLHEALGQPHVVHNHGLWMWPGRQARIFAARRQAKLVISCHNMLDPVYLRRSRLIKCAARVLYENRNLHSAACLHALASHEADAIRASRFDNPVAVIPNGIDVRSFENMPCRHAASHTWPRLRGKNIILFLGRIHPVKGLVNLIQAWAHIAVRFKDWHLVISGPDCEGHMATVQEQVCTCRLTEKVTFTGPAYGSAKLALLAAADVFVLPSISEGFSISTLEAMASRVPVLMTTRSGLAELQTAGAGRLIETSPESIAEGLDYMLSLTDHQRAAMGYCGRQLAAQKYSWTIVAKQMLSVYRWILGQGEKPACVIDN